MKSLSILQKIEVRPKVEMSIIEKVYVHLKKEVDNSNHTFKTTPQFNLYHCDFGAGNKPVFLLTKPYEKIVFGVGNWCVRPMVDVEVKEYLMKLFKNESELFMK